MFFVMREKSNQFKRTNQWPRGMNRTLLLLDEFSKLPPLGGEGEGHKNDSIYISYIQISRTKKLQPPGVLNIQETPGYR